MNTKQLAKDMLNFLDHTEQRDRFTDWMEGQSGNGDKIESDLNELQK